MVYTTSCPSPLGTLTLASDGASLIGLWIEGQKYFAAAVPGTNTLKEELPIFGMTKNWLTQYFNGENPPPDALPLAPQGSAFRTAVWNILREIPYGTYTTYGEIAKRIAAETRQSSMSGQAVGGAVAHNPISIIIPCHRVVGTNGSLTGYAGGISKKIWLLEHEGIDMSLLRTPSRGTAL